MYSRRPDAPSIPRGSASPSVASGSLQGSAQQPHRHEAQLDELLRKAKVALDQAAAEFERSAAASTTDSTVLQSSVLDAIDEPGFVSVQDTSAVDCGAFVILIGVLTSVARHVSTPQVRVTAIALMARLGVYVDDETRLQVCSMRSCCRLCALHSQFVSHIFTEARAALCHPADRQIASRPRARTGSVVTHALPRFEVPAIRRPAVPDVRAARCLQAAV